MSLFASAGFSVRDAQAGEKRGGIAAHKYEGLTNYQRTIPRARKTTAKPQSAEILQHTSKRASLEMKSKSDDEKTPFVIGNEPVRMNGERHAAS
jgi:hypothetical protein